MIVLNELFLYEEVKLPVVTDVFLMSGMDRPLVNEISRYKLYTSLKWLNRTLCQYAFKLLKIRTTRNIILHNTE